MQNLTIPVSFYYSDLAALQLGAENIKKYFQESERVMMGLISMSEFSTEPLYLIVSTAI